MSSLKIRNLFKRYGSFAAAQDVSFDVAEGEFVSLLGPSGCGKTTTLRMIAGFIRPTSGNVQIADDDVTDLPPWRRDTGMVFQSYALFPHLTVAKNVAFGLEMRKMPKSEIAARVAEALRLVRLDAHADRLPRQMSGGQQQRVALARALAVRPRVLLLDEPLSNLDAKLREQVRIEIRQLQQSLKLTTIMVTHDQEEALTMSDRLIVMNQGQVMQVGSPRDLYQNPASRFVANFVGRSAFLEGSVAEPGRFETDGGLVLDCAPAVPKGRAVMALRPESIAFGPAAGVAGNSVDGTIEFVSFLGASVDILVRLSAQDSVTVTRHTSTLHAEPRVGDRCSVHWPISAVSLFMQ